MKVFAKDFFDNFKNYSAIVSGLAFFICMIISLSSTSRLFSSFGIDFFANAELGDYITLGVRKITLSLESFTYAAVLTSMIYAILDFFENHGAGLENKKNGAVSSALHSLRQQLKILHNPLIIIGIFALISTALISLNTSSLNTNSIKSTDNNIKILKYGKNETELKCVSFIGNTGSFSHYWSITDKSVKSINTSSIQIIETMFEAAKQPYLTFTPENSEPEGEIGPTGQKPRYPPTSPFYEKWRNEIEKRTINITSSCTKISKDILQ